MRKLTVNTFLTLDGIMQAPGGPAAHWPHATDGPGAKPLNDARKYVASRTLHSLDWSNSVLDEPTDAEIERRRKLER